MDDAPQPLTPDEERLWRALNRMLFLLPKAMDQDLQKLGLNNSRYGILFNLSEAPAQTLRMNEIAERTALSASRISRIVDALEADGYVRRSPSAEDGRGLSATLTPKGLARLQAAWPGHLHSARRRVMSQVAETGIDVAGLTELVERIIARSEAP